MKQLSIVFLFAAVMFMACHHSSGTHISYDPLADSTWVVSPVPATAPHIVLIEEFSGQGCAKVPYDDIVLDSGARGGLATTIAYYLKDDSIAATIPPAGAAYDLRSTIATQMATSSIYDNCILAAIIPGAGIDRIPAHLGGSNTVAVPDDFWQIDIYHKINEGADSLNLDVTSSYNAGTRVATITVTVTYTIPMTTQQNLSVAVVTDSITDLQADANGHIDSAYVSNNVFIGMVTPIPLGDTVLSTMPAKEAGRVQRKRYAYTLPTGFALGTINPANCRVVAFVHAPGAGSDYHVMQAAQTKLAP